MTPDEQSQLGIVRLVLDEVRGIRGDLQSKADKADLARMEGRLDEHGRQLADLTAWRHDQTSARRTLSTWGERITRFGGWIVATGLVVLDLIIRH